MSSPTLKCATGLIASVMSGMAAFGQSDSLSLSSGATTPGGTVSLNLTLDSPAGNEPAAIQWTFAYSPSDIVSVSASAGAAATAAGKSLVCAGSPGSYTCFLTGLNAGGLDASIIENGVVAVLTATLSPVSPGTTIGIANPLSASAAAGAIQTTGAGGTATAVAPLGLATLNCNPATVPSGASAVCTVSLNRAAPLNTIVTLSDNNALLTIPPLVTIPAGADSATFAATAGDVTANQSASVTATLNGATESVGLSLAPPMLVSAITCNPTTLDAGLSATCSVALSVQAPSGGVTVPVSANSPALTVPASVSIPAGALSGSFVATAATTPPLGGAIETVSVMATLNGIFQSASLTLVVCPCSLWPSTAQPLNPASANKLAIEAGLRFTSAISGYITGVRFFKGSTNLGTHIGNLWAANGTNLARVTFTAETKSGWQVAYFPTPVAIAANTPYVISYHAPQGHTAADNGVFTTPVTSLPLAALANGQNSPNGVYLYGSSGFPTAAADATNYWVDAIFNTSATVGTAAPVSLWPPTAIPKTPAAPSSQPAELGMRFISEVPGYVTGLRFYKSAKNAGPHTGYLWTSTGALLASVTFANESAKGWQQANFATPVAIDANTPLVVAYWSPKGSYADDAGYFATSGVTNQMLYAPPDGQYGPNGSYAKSNTFPASSSNASNYWVDVVFSVAIQ